eukprot:TRINITY_DN64624_c0_g1_i1.p5 TRINITY_DN64624_c0_g1~~TRINITY_DN64624_c0_g1_i1.p5  ORF type:complete len:126 (+),score=12.77 TRINITY_DN64624_c0_g1_i1:1161-1538(+)
MYLQPVRTPAKTIAPRKLSPLMNNVRLGIEEEEKRLDISEDPEEAMFFQAKGIHLTPNYQRISRYDSPRESQEMAQDYFFGESIVSPFRSVNKQLYRTNNYGQDLEDITRKFFQKRTYTLPFYLY